MASKELRIISVLTSVKGNAHRAMCYSVDRMVFKHKLRAGYKEAFKTIGLIDDAEIILIEDINLSVHILKSDLSIESYKEMDIYYAYYDVLSVCMTKEIRLTKQSFHDECLLMQRFSYPSTTKLSYIELRQGLTKAINDDTLKKEKALGKIEKVTFRESIEPNFKGSITGLFLNTFKNDIISLVFWPDEFIVGLMLNDYKIIPLKLNEASYEKVAKVYKFKPRE